MNDQKIYNGIDMYYGSSGTPYGNTVEGSNYGLYCDTQSWLSATDHGTEARNTVDDNNYGLVAYGGSEIDLGTIMGENIIGRCNKIFGNASYDVFANQESYIFADANWWEEDGPAFGAFNNSYVYVDYWMSDPDDCNSYYFSGFTASPAAQDASSAGEPQSPVNADAANELKAAKRATEAKDYSTASAHYETLLASGRTEAQKLALSGLFQLQRAANDPSYLSRFETFSYNSGDVGRVASEILPIAYLRAGQKTDAIQAARNVCKKFPGSESEMNALVFLASIGEKEFEGHSVMRQITEGYGSKLNAGIFAALGGYSAAPE
ncbi:MAG: hypothetical protein WBD36_05050, partial [Bacteroidota bacterium]